MVNEDELRALASKWKQTAMEQVPAAYADRGLHGKYLKLDNYAAGLDDCAIDLLELLDTRSPTTRAAVQSEQNETYVNGLDADEIWIDDQPVMITIKPSRSNRSDGG